MLGEWTAVRQDLSDTFMGSERGLTFYNQWNAQNKQTTTSSACSSTSSAYQSASAAYSNVRANPGPRHFILWEAISKPIENLDLEVTRHKQNVNKRKIAEEEDESSCFETDLEENVDDDTIEMFAFLGNSDWFTNTDAHSNVDVTEPITKRPKPDTDERAVNQAHSEEEINESSESDSSNSDDDTSSESSDSSTSDSDSDDDPDDVTSSDSDAEVDLLLNRNVCPYSCVCRVGSYTYREPQRIQRRFRNVRPLYKKLLQRQSQCYYSMELCCRWECCIQWHMPSFHEMIGDYHPSDLNVCRFPWGDWKPAAVILEEEL